MVDIIIHYWEMAEMRKKEAKESIAILGGHEKDLAFLDYPDRGLKCDKESVNRLLSILNDYRPQAVYVPFFIDDHRDHRSTVAILASALMHYPYDISCYNYEVWTPLSPNLVVDITHLIDKKLEAIKAHKSQINIINYPEKIRGLNAYRSITAGKDVEYCEAFYKCSKQEYIAIAKEMVFEQIIGLKEP